MLPFGVTIQATVPQRLEIPDGLMNYPVFADGQMLGRMYTSTQDKNYGIRSKSKVIFSLGNSIQI